MQEEQLPDPLLVIVGLVPDVALRVERPRQHAEVREAPDERVRGGLEDPGQQRAVRVRRDLDVGARLVLRGYGPFVGGGREIPDDRVEQRLEPDPVGRGADEHGSENRFFHALAEAGLELGVGDLLAVEVLHQHVVVGLRGRLEELVAAARHLVGHVGRDLGLDLLAALVDVGLAMDEVDVALEVVGGPDRELEWRDLVAERPPERVERGASGRRSPCRTC